MQLELFFEKAKVDMRIGGFIPWHFSTARTVKSTAKKPAHDVYCWPTGDNLGGDALPAVAAMLKKIGTYIVQHGAAEGYSGGTALNSDVAPQ